MTDEDVKDLTCDIWDQIGHDRALAVSVTRGLVEGCLATCDERDRDLIKEIFFGATTFVAMGHAVH